MLSIKEYAEHQGISIQAVYQSLKRQENQKALKGHITLINGKKMLDDYAVEFLDKSRIQNPVVLMQETESERVAELERDNEKLTAAILDLQDRMIKKQEFIQELQNKLIETKELKTQLITTKEINNGLNEQITAIQEELETERAKTWWDKLWHK